VDFFDSHLKSAGRDYLEDRVKSFRKRSQFLNGLASGIAAVGLLIPVAASAAGVTISLTPAIVSAGSSANSFDVDLTNFGPSSITVGGFAFGLSIANANISFTDVTISTAALYVFSGNSLFGPDLSGPSSGQTIFASDSVVVPFSGVTVNSGSTFGLGHVLFDVSAKATSGVFAVNLAAFPLTNLSDAAGNNLNVDTLSPGQITIQAVPEPSSMLMLLFAMSAVAATAKRDRYVSVKRRASGRLYPGTTSARSSAWAWIWQRRD
jgi:PEP-CTERM motif